MNIIAHENVTFRGPPASTGTLPVSWRSAMPDLCSLLEDANGLVLHDGLLRIFGVGDECAGRSALAWNRAEWRRAYGLPESIAFWGENVFGDQFGSDLGSGGVVMLHCEGGRLDRLPGTGPRQHIERMLTEDPRTWIECDLVEAAVARRLKPSLFEHLSFEVPLVCGGAADENNLEVMEAGAHLELLGQIVQQSRGAPERTDIVGFRG